MEVAGLMNSRGPLCIFRKPINPEDLCIPNVLSDDMNHD